MRKSLFYLMAMVIVTVAASPQSVQVTSPNGTENWIAGVSKSVTWKYENLPAGTLVKLVLFKGGIDQAHKVGNIVQSIPAGTNGSGSCPWTVGNYEGGTATSGPGFYIRVITMDGACRDESDSPFAIAASPLIEERPGNEFSHKPGRVIFASPNSADVVIAGQELPIRWSFLGYVPEKCVRVSYVRYVASPSEEGSLIQAINTPAGEIEITPRTCAGELSWTLPLGTAGDYPRIKVETLDHKVVAQSGQLHVYSAKPDLAFGPGGEVPGNLSTLDCDRFKLKVTVCNHQGGTAPFSHAQVVFMPRDGDRQRMVSKIFNVPALTLNEKHEFTFSLPAGYTPQNGWYDVTIDLDYDLRLEETDEGNNRRTQAVLFQGVPNLAVCVKERLEAVTTREEALRAIVKNTGQAISAKCVTRWHIEGHGTKEFQIPNLNPGQEHTITRRVTWWTGGTDDFSIVIDYGMSPELSTADNQRRGVIVRHVWGTPVTPYDNTPACAQD